jgi:DNA-binding IclR family transcriptional regulator
MAPATPDPQFATTLAHGLMLLECFRYGHTTLSNKDLSLITGLSKSTVSRLTYTLAQRGLIIFDQRLRQYSLGPIALALGHPLLVSLNVRQAAQPLMRELAMRVDGTVNLAMRDRDRMVYVDTYRGHLAPTFHPEIGASVPLLSSTLGRAWMFRIPQSIRDKVIRDARIRLPAEWARFEPNINKAFRDLDEHGYCSSVGGETVPELDAVGAPLQTEVEGTILCFNCAVLRTRNSERKLHSVMGPGLVALVRQVDHLISKG